MTTNGFEILGFPIHPVTCEDAAKSATVWAQASESRVVLAANVHMVMEARDDSLLLAQLRAADLSVPDGRPLVWALRMRGVKAEQVRGADLMRQVLQSAAGSGVAVGLYGSTPETLTALEQHILSQYPSLRVPFAVSPPFRELSATEDEVMVTALRDSGAGVLFVGLGCPKQERWMMAHRGHVPCVMIGVGAAFDFLTGAKPQAPRWMQQSGLEWLHRLASDPRRLWKRYLKHNPRFVLLFALEYARHLLSRFLPTPRRM